MGCRPVSAFGLPACFVLTVKTRSHPTCFVHALVNVCQLRHLLLLSLAANLWATAVFDLFDEAGARWSLFTLHGPFGVTIHGLRSDQSRFLDGFSLWTDQPNLSPKKIDETSHSDESPFQKTKKTLSISLRWSGGVPVEFDLK